MCDKCSAGFEPSLHTSGGEHPCRKRIKSARGPRASAGVLPRRGLQRTCALSNRRGRQARWRKWTMQPLLGLELQVSATNLPGRARENCLVQANGDERVSRRKNLWCPFSVGSNQSTATSTSPPRPTLESDCPRALLRWCTVVCRVQASGSESRGTGLRPLTELSTLQRLWSRPSRTTA